MVLPFVKSPVTTDNKPILEFQIKMIGSKKVPNCNIDISVALNDQAVIACSPCSRDERLLMLTAYKSGASRLSAPDCCKLHRRGLSRRSAGLMIVN